jgi:hypothetical protein
MGWDCAWCLVQNVNSGLKRVQRQTANAAEAWQALNHHALTCGDEDLRVLGGFELVGGHGDCPPRGTLCSLGALADGILIVAETGATGRLFIPYADVLTVEVDGKGFIQRNAGLIGGGSGIRGALTGIALARMVNNATAKTTVDSFLRITATESELLFSHWKLPPATVRNILSRIFTRQQAAARAAVPPLVVERPAPVAASPPPPSPTPLDELERLTKLHAAGTLTDTEFEMARARQIKRLHSEVS